MWNLLSIAGEPLRYPALHRRKRAFCSASPWVSDLVVTRAPADLRAPPDTAGSGRKPEAEEPPARDVEQEVAGGRTAATPVGVLLGVTVTVAGLVLAVLALVVFALAGTDAVA
jgi:hypothetical protein